MARFNSENYVDVQERIVRFWGEHPEGAIRTRLMSPPDDFTQCRYEAAIYKRAEQSMPDATGYAFELAGTSTAAGANFTSHEENCETSAIGRALANMGYAKTREDRPSRQEMEKVNRAETRQAVPGRTQPSTPRQTASPPATPPQTGNPPATDSTPGEITDWTSFWAVVRPLGYQDRPDLEAKLGFAIKAMTPQQALDAVNSVINPTIPAPA